MPKSATLEAGIEFLTRICTNFRCRAALGYEIANIQLSISFENASEANFLGSTRLACLAPGRAGTICFAQRAQARQAALFQEAGEAGKLSETNFANDFFSWSGVAGQSNDRIPALKFWTLVSFQPRSHHGCRNPVNRTYVLGKFCPANAGQGLSADAYR